MNDLDTEDGKVTAATQPMSHRAACNAIATYAMNQLKWCDLAAVEVAGRRCGTPPPTKSTFDGFTRDEVDAARRAREEWFASHEAGGGQLDVLALTGVRTRERKKARSNAKRWPASRVAVFEVKVQRSDMLSDLRAQKLRRYEPQASHCYLAVAKSCLLCAERIEYRRGGITRVRWRVDPAAALEELDGLNLPEGWGVVLFESEGFVPSPSCIRNPTGKHLGALVVDDDILLALVEQVAVSLCYRAAR